VGGGGCVAVRFAGSGHGGYSVDVPEREYVYAQRTNKALMCVIGNFMGIRGGKGRNVREREHSEVRRAHLVQKCVIGNMNRGNRWINRGQEGAGVAHIPAC
jgi:hypothetical protein